MGEPKQPPKAGPFGHLSLLGKALALLTAAVTFCSAFPFTLWIAGTLGWGIYQRALLVVPVVMLGLGFWVACTTICEWLGLEIEEQHGPLAGQVCDPADAEADAGEPTTSFLHRWYAFSLRTVFVVVTVVGCWLGYEVHWIRSRTQTSNDLRAQGHIVRVRISGSASSPDAKIPFWRCWFGDSPVGVIEYLGKWREGERERLQSLFPEANVYNWPDAASPTPRPASRSDQH